MGLRTPKQQLHCSKCRGANDRNNQRYCKACHAASMRANRPVGDEIAPEELAKAKCRARTRSRIKSGELTPQPCEGCGAEKVEVHHPDYSNDMLVVWYCRPCHLAHHEANKPEKRPARTKVPAREALKRWMADVGA